MHAALENAVDSRRRARAVDRVWDLVDWDELDRLRREEDAVIRAVIDSSAWIRARRSPPEVARRISTAARDGHLALCEPVRLELLRGARSGLDAVDLDEALGTLVTLPADDVAWRLARRTLVQLAHLPGGRHRARRRAIVIAAIAERHEVAVLHDDARFELIAEVTGQRVARVAPQRLDVAEPVERGIRIP